MSKGVRECLKNQPNKGVLASERSHNAGRVEVGRPLKPLKRITAQSSVLRIRVHHETICEEICNEGWRIGQSGQQVQKGMGKSSPGKGNGQINNWAV